MPKLGIPGRSHVRRWMRRSLPVVCEKPAEGGSPDSGPATPTRCERQGPRPSSSRGRRRHRDTRHHLALVPAAAKKYDGAKTRRPGRPNTKPDIAALVVRLANEHPTWGSTPIRGGLKSLGHDVARNTIKAILKDHGIEPAPERGTKTPWKTVLAAHWDVLAAADFFTVEVLTMAGLVRYVVLFVMRLKTRSVEIVGITSQPDSEWMTHVARNLTDCADGFLRGVQYVILDRDPLYTAAFRTLLRTTGVKPLRLPARSPNLNAYAERFVGSVRAECLERIVPLGERHLRGAVQAFVHHYHEERPHQGL